MTRIETQIHAGCLAELDHGWRIVAHKRFNDCEECGQWVYVDRFTDHGERLALFRARDIGSVLTVTRRETDGSLVLLAKLAEPSRWSKALRPSGRWGS